jgi:AraC family transcriptional regulator of adaptative response/methylated-DNA-[protein]-cysteine methyltransferase
MSKIYYQIEKVIHYMAIESQMSPPVERLAEIINLESDDFRRVFNQWSGVDPETFLRYLSPQLRNRKDSNAPDLFDAADSKQLSNKTRLHDRFLNIIKMSTEETKNGGESLAIKYSVQHSPFGRMMVASTGKGVCRISFLSEEEQPDDILQNEFTEAEISQVEMPEHVKLAGFFRETGSPETTIDLHVKGTPFQINVWEALLRIPEGDLGCCSDIAKEIDNPKALRAVGSAVGKNPIAFFIPCHRVVPVAGGFGNYRWGINRKMAMIGWEAMRASTEVKSDHK